MKILVKEYSKAIVKEGCSRSGVKVKNIRVLQKAYEPYGDLGLYEVDVDTILSKAEVIKVLIQKAGFQNSTVNIM